MRTDVGWAPVRWPVEASPGQGHGDVSVLFVAVRRPGTASRVCGSRPAGSWTAVGDGVGFAAEVGQVGYLVVDATIRARCTDMTPALDSSYIVAAPSYWTLTAPSSKRPVACQPDGTTPLPGAWDHLDV